MEGIRAVYKQCCLSPISPQRSAPGSFCQDFHRSSPSSFELCFSFMATGKPTGSPRAVYALSKPFFSETGVDLISAKGLIIADCWRGSSTATVSDATRILGHYSISHILSAALLESKPLGRQGRNGWKEDRAQNSSPQRLSSDSGASGAGERKLQDSGLTALISTSPPPPSLNNFESRRRALFWAKLRTSAWTGISNGPSHVCHVPRMLLQAEPPNVIGASEEGLRKRRFGADAGPQAAKLANNLKRSANLQICRCARSRSLSGWTSVPLSGIFWGAKVFPVVIPYPRPPPSHLETSCTLDLDIWHIPLCASGFVPLLDQAHFDETGQFVVVVVSWPLLLDMRVPRWQES
ncbi:hypothetical protein V8E51_006870 [Hyaloscypha variabilis]